MSLTMTERLNKCAEDGNVEALYSILAENPYLLDQIDKSLIVHTPLHIAARLGNTHFAIEIATLKPSLARKLNPQGLSPMHVALQTGQKQVVRALLTIDRELVRVKGMGGITPLHYVAAQMEDLDLLAEFLCACPSSVEDLTVQCETAVHVAVKNKRLDAVQVLTGWLLRVNKEEVLNWKDQDGNTVLHIATFTNQPEVMKLVIRHVNVNAKNFNSLTAMDIFDGQGYSLGREVLKDILGRAGAKRTSQLDSATTFERYRRRLPFSLLDDSATTIASYLRRPLSLIEKRNKFLGISIINKKKSSRDVLLVIAILIATSTFQAVLSPPIQLWQEDTELSNTTIKTEIFGLNMTEMIKRGRPVDLYMFFSFNTVAFFTSFAIIIAAIIDLPLFILLFPSAMFLSLTYYYCLANTILYSPMNPTNLALRFLLISFIALCAVIAITFPLIALVQHLMARRRVDSSKRHL